MLFNNEIYGLTKGQYSPTSRTGTRSPSSPAGSIEAPVVAASFALGAGARFVARSVDTAQKHLIDVLKRAHHHQGASFVEIFQNCIVYNDDVFGEFTGREVAADAQILVEHGQPLLFGRDRSRGLRLKPGTVDLEVVAVSDGTGIAEGVLVHDMTSRALAMMLAQMQPPAMPMALGVLYCDPAPSFEARRAETARAGRDGPSTAALNALLRRGDTWTVKA
jgi:2-oxoglutarate ferredoxin oxidoreductase subunit beta